MIRFTTGNILNAEAEALVNTVNCVGVMGRGVALQFKQAFPANFKQYAAACERGDVSPGRMFVFDSGELTNPRYIINFPTKRHWRGKSRIEDIESGLVALRAEIEKRRILSIALPPLGSGLGGLDWRVVRPLIERRLCDLSDVDITVFEPMHSQAEIKPNRSTRVPAMTAGRAALVSLMSRYLDGLMDVEVSLLEAHKLMYLLQEAGEPLRLRYVAATYGPYAENLRHVLRDIEGHLVSGYADGGDAPTKALAIVPGALEEAERFLSTQQDTLHRFDCVSRVVEGFESPFGLELLTTVHWVLTRTATRTPDTVSQAVFAWGEQKRKFTRQQIAIAVERLTSQGWAEGTSRIG